MDDAGINVADRPAGQVPVPNDIQATPIGTAAWVCATIEMPENTELQPVGLSKTKVIEVVVPALTTSALGNILELEANGESWPKPNVVGPLTLATCGVPTV